jgi:recombination protein RecA
MIVIDSVAALTPRAEIEGDMGDSHMGLQFVECSLAA